jgi:hypothetical protein
LVKHYLLVKPRLFWTSRLIDFEDRFITTDANVMGEMILNEAEDYILEWFY